MENSTTELVPRETLLEGRGHGWLEGRYILDEGEEPEYTLTECVWINGIIACEDGDTGDAQSRYYREHYGQMIRVWQGETPPDEEQRRETPWKE